MKLLGLLSVGTIAFLGVNTFKTASAQGPGDGVSKTTYSASDPWRGMAFVQRYFPTTAAEGELRVSRCGVVVPEKRETDRNARRRAQTLATVT